MSLFLLRVHQFFMMFVIIFMGLLIDVLNVLEVAGLCCFSDHGMKVGVCLLFVLSSGSLLRSPMFYGNLLLRE